MHVYSDPYFLTWILWLNLMNFDAFQLLPLLEWGLLKCLWEHLSDNFLVPLIQKLHLILWGGPKAVPCLMSLGVLRGTILFWRREDCNGIGEPLSRPLLCRVTQSWSILNLIVHEVSAFMYLPYFFFSFEILFQTLSFSVSEKNDRNWIYILRQWISHDFFDFINNCVRMSNM